MGVTHFAPCRKPLIYLTFGIPLFGRLCTYNRIFWEEMNTCEHNICSNTSFVVRKTRLIQGTGLRLLGYACKFVKNLSQRWASNRFTKRDQSNSMTWPNDSLPDEHIHSRFHAILDVAVFGKGSEGDDWCRIAYLTN